MNQKVYTTEQEDKIMLVLNSYRGDYERAAKKLLIPERHIQAVDMKRTGKFNYTPEGRGPRHLQRYIVAIRDVAKIDGWDRDEKIDEARRLYDEGRIEMATGRDGFNLILYAIPRRVTVKRKPYFTEQKLQVVN